MAVILDILGSLIIASLVVLAINNGAADLNRTTYEQTYSLNVQTNMVALARMIEYDFVKMGFRSPSPPILSADSQRIAFQSELYFDGSLRTVRYTVGSSNDSTAIRTSNPRDFVLVREVSGEPTITFNAGLVEFHMLYLDSTGSVTFSPSDIRAVRVKMRLETPEPIDTLYPGVFWEKTLYPKNL